MTQPKGIVFLDEFDPMHPRNARALIEAKLGMYRSLSFMILHPRNKRTGRFVKRRWKVAKLKMAKCKSIDIKGYLVP